jgi:hypothetical protein
MHSLELMIIFVHPDGVHNFRIFDAFLTLLFAVDGFVADDVVSVDSSEDAPFTEVDDAVTAATFDGDGAAASKTMTPLLLLLLRSSEEAGALLLPLPSAFIVALAVSFNPFGMVVITKCVFCVL